MIDPARKSLELGRWLPEDREALQRAISEGGLFDDAGLARHWSPPTRRRHVWSLGRYFTFLGQRAPAARGFERFSPELLQVYVDTLRGQALASRTVWGYVDSLDRCLRVMWPERDWSWFRPVVNRLHRAVIPVRHIASRLRPSRELFGRGIAEAKAADENESLDPVRRATRVRDGVMLAFQTACALRLKNLAMIENRLHLERTSTGYEVHFIAGEMKGRRAHQLPLPDEVTPLLDRYLAHHRTVLLRGRQSDAVWITQDATDLSYFGAARRLRIITERWFGVAIAPHYFRHCLATSIARETPAKAAIASAILAHRSFGVTEGYIRHGQQIDASRAMNRHIAELRRAFRKGHHVIESAKRSAP